MPCVCEETGSCVSAGKEDVEEFRAEGIQVLSLIEKFVEEDVALLRVRRFHGVLL